MEKFQYVDTLTRVRHQQFRFWDLYHIYAAVADVVGDGGGYSNYGIMNKNIQNSKQLKFCSYRAIN